MKLTSKLSLMNKTIAADINVCYNILVGNGKVLIFDLKIVGCVEFCKVRKRSFESVRIGPEVAPVFGCIIVSSVE